MAQRKRATRSAPASNKLSLALPKPRNAVLQAAALGQVKMGTAKHEKSKGAQRRAQKMALQKDRHDAGSEPS
jgi:hypothetical protein